MFKSAFIAGAALLVGASVMFIGPAPAQTADRSEPQIPDFSGIWRRDDPNMAFMPPPEGYHPPVREHPDYTRQPREEVTVPWTPDPTDPLLKPWAQAHLEGVLEDILAGEEVLPAHSLCWPAGVPGSLRLRENVQFLQEEDQVTILFQRDHQVRQVYLNRPHSPNVEHSWYGESVGHYEGGDTLVVDTTGLDDRSAVDWIYTPHTEDLHVMERYRLIDENTIEVLFTVEDAETFNEPWASIVHYRRQGPNARIAEIVCAENNKQASTGEDYPIPIADKIDF